LGGRSLHFGTTLETTFSPLSFGKFHENPFSHSRERLSGIFLTDGKSKKKQKTENRKKTSVKHIRIRLIGGCVTVNEGCNSCASLAGLVLSFIARFILLVIAP